LRAEQIMHLLDGTLLMGPLPEQEVCCACGSDMMSDVLAFPKDSMVLLTGLTNLHSVRTAELLDVLLLVFVRGKQPTQDVLNLAREKGIAVIGTKYTLYDACGRLFNAGLPGGTGRKA